MTSLTHLKHALLQCHSRVTPIFIATLALLLLGLGARSEEKTHGQSVTLTNMDVLDDVHKIRSGDSLWIEIISEKRHQFDSIVSAKGVLEVPGFVRMKAVGTTPRSLAFQMKSRLEAAGGAVTSVRVGHWRGLPKSDKPDTPDLVVFGFVGRQGKYKWTDDQEVTISGLLRRAGGVTSERKTPKIVIIRKTPQGNKRILVNAGAVLIERRPEYDLFLRPFDVVMVE